MATAKVIAKGLGIAGKKALASTAEIAKPLAKGLEKSISNTPVKKVGSAVRKTGKAVAVSGIVATSKLSEAVQTISRIGSKKARRPAANSTEKVDPNAITLNYSDIDIPTVGRIFSYAKDTKLSEMNKKFIGKKFSTVSRLAKKDPVALSVKTEMEKAGKTKVGDSVDEGVMEVVGSQRMKELDSVWGTADDIVGNFSSVRDIRTRADEIKKKAKSKLTPDDIIVKNYWNNLMDAQAKGKLGYDGTEIANGTVKNQDTWYGKAIRFIDIGLGRRIRAKAGQNEVADSAMGMLSGIAELTESTVGQLSGAFSKSSVEFHVRRAMTEAGNASANAKRIFVEEISNLPNPVSSFIAPYSKQYTAFKGEIRKAILGGKLLPETAELAKKAALPFQKFLKESIDFAKDSGMKIGEFNNYFPAIWLVDGPVRLKSHIFKSKLAKHASRINVISPEQAKVFVDQAYNKMIKGELDTLDFSNLGTSARQKSRQIVLDAEAYEDMSEFLLTDPDVVMRAYSRAMGGRIRYFQLFGDIGDQSNDFLSTRMIRNLEKAKTSEIEKRTKAIPKGTSKADRAEMIEAWNLELNAQVANFSQDLADTLRRVITGSTRTTPEHWAMTQGLSTVNRLSSTAFLGMSAMSVYADAGILLIKELNGKTGVRKLADAAYSMENLDKDLLQKIGGPLNDYATEGDLLFKLNGQGEVDLSLFSPGSTMAEKTLEMVNKSAGAAQHAALTASFMRPLTKMMTRVAAAKSIDEVIDVIPRVINKVATDDEIAMVSRLFKSEDSLNRIGVMLEQNKARSNSGAWISRGDAWTDAEAFDDFISVVDARINEILPHGPSATTMPKFHDTALGRTFLQWTPYPLSVFNKYAHVLANEDAAELLGAVTATTLAASLALTSKDIIKGKELKDPDQILYDGFMYSGLLGYFAQTGDFAGRILGLSDRHGNPTEAFGGGPALSTLKNINAVIKGEGANKLLPRNILAVEILRKLSGVQDDE